jgi:hypothetical protein
MTNANNDRTEWTKDKGDIGDEICPHDVAIYVIQGVKVGQTIDFKTRMKAQKFDSDRRQIYMIVPANTASHNDIWEWEDRLAYRMGLPVEHDGQRKAMLRSRLGNFSGAREYNVTNTNTDANIAVSDPGAFERNHGLNQGALSACANPKCAQKNIKINGVKHTVSYADNKKGCKLDRWKHAITMRLKIQPELVTGLDETSEVNSLSMNTAVNEATTIALAAKGNMNDLTDQ